MKTAAVTYCGIPLVCEYEYEPAEASNWIDPGCPESAHLCSAKVAGVDIFEMFTREQQDEVENLILEAKGAQDEADAGEYADMRRSERQMEAGYP